MKKAITLVLILVSFLIIFCSCSEKTNGVSNTPIVSSASSISGDVESDVNTESSEQSTEAHGVPESVVLRNVSIPQNHTYEIIHKYDSAAHIDDVELITSYSGKFGTQTQKYAYAYQYNRSTDLWSLISGDNGLQSDVTALNEEAYLNNNFKGEFERFHSGSYSITIKEIDFLNKTVTVEYLLSFDDGSPALSDVKTLEISDTTTGKLCFVIQYKRSVVVSFEQVFVFDIDKGLYA